MSELLMVTVDYSQYILENVMKCLNLNDQNRNNIESIDKDEYSRKYKIYYEFKNLDSKFWSKEHYLIYLIPNCIAFYFLFNSAYKNFFLNYGYHTKNTIEYLKHPKTLINLRKVFLRKAPLYFIVLGSIYLHEKMLFKYVFETNYLNIDEETLKKIYENKKINVNIQKSRKKSY